MPLTPTNLDRLNVLIGHAVSHVTDPSKPETRFWWECRICGTRWLTKEGKKHEHPDNDCCAVQLRKALAEPRAEWREMGTWPEKPGHYLIHDGRDQYVAYWAPAIAHRPVGQYCWTGFVFNRLNAEVLGWMPLPALPSAAEGQKETT